MDRNLSIALARVFPRQFANIVKSHIFKRRNMLDRLTSIIFGFDMNLYCLLIRIASYVRLYQPLLRANAVLQICLVIFIYLDLDYIIAYMNLSNFMIDVKNRQLYSYRQNRSKLNGLPSVFPAFFSYVVHV